jgi:hypothetical protein
MFVPRKKTLNLNVPSAIAAEFEGIHAQCGLTGKEKWVTASAAILALSQLPDADRDVLLKAVRGVIAEAGYAPLVGEAHARRLANSLRLGDDVSSQGEIEMNVHRKRQESAATRPVPTRVRSGSRTG